MVVLDGCVGMTDVVAEWRRRLPRIESVLGSGFVAH